MHQRAENGCIGLLVNCEEKYSMKKLLMFFCFLFLSISTSVFAQDDHYVTHWTEHPNFHSQFKWGYSGQRGPQYWGGLSLAFSVCSMGKNQSPINLSEFTEGELAPISFKYMQAGSSVLNNGHTIQVNYDKNSSISINQHSFELKQFHFHAPSENHINEKSFPMEVHFVHADKKGNLAVIAVMIKKGQLNTELEKVWENLPMRAGNKNQLQVKVSASALLPDNKDYYRFNGSLTTPPCTEGVWWLVMKDSISASAGQLKKFTEAIGHPNNRPIQPTNARMIVK